MIASLNKKRKEEFQRYRGKTREDETSHPENKKVEVGVKKKTKAKK